MQKTQVTCQECGEGFLAYLSQKKKFCSIACKNFCRKKTLICKQCGKGFELNVSTIKAREKRGPIKFCCFNCYKASIAIKEKTCVGCKKQFTPKRKTQKFCSNECSYGAKIGIRTGDGFWYENGYKVIYTSNGEGIKEHILIIENKIGRKLKKNECVHHKDEIKDNNDISNLELMTRGEHSKLHRRLEAEKGKKFFGGE